MSRISAAYRGIFCILFTLLSATAAGKSRDLFILKPGNLSSLKTYPASATYADIISHELRRYFSPLRGVRVVRKAYPRPLAKGHFAQNPASIVADCRYRMSGSASAPKIEIELRILSGPKGRVIFSKKTVSTADRAFFDSMDTLSSQAVRSLKNFINPAPQTSPKPQATPTPQPRFGMLVLSNFSIGDGQYELRVNSNTIDETDPAYFYYAIPLLPGETHNVELYHLPEERKVLSIDWAPSAGEVKTLSYRAEGSLVLPPLKNPRNWESYQAYLDGVPVSNGTMGLPAGRTHRLAILDSGSNTVWTDSRHIADGESWKPEPRIDFHPEFRAKIYLSDGLYPGGGIDWAFHPWFWAGIALGIQNFQIDTASCWVFYPQIEAGYWIVGGSPDDLAVGGGLTLQYPLGIPNPAPPSHPSYSRYYPGIGCFFDLRAFHFYARPAFYYDWLRSTFQFQIQGGIRF